MFAIEEDTQEIHLDSSITRSFGNLRLRFRSEKLEEQSLVHSAQLNILPLMGSGIVLFTVAASYIFWYWSPVMELDSSPRLMAFFSEVCIAFMGLVFFSTGCRLRFKNSITAEDSRCCQRLIVFYYMILIALALTSERYRAAKLHNMDPHVAFPEISVFTDSDFLLMLDAYVTVSSLLFQIDPFVYAIIPVCACSMFLFSSVFIGSSENTEPVKATLMLTGLGVLAILGRRLTDGDKRSLFLEISVERSGKLEQRVQRFAAEHQRDRLVDTHNKLVGNLTNEKQGSSSGDGATSTTSHPHSSGTGLVSNPSSGKQATIPSENEKCSENDVISYLSSSLAPTESLPTLQNVTTYKDSATDPLVSWGETGWKCNRCSKPPLPPTSMNSSIAGTSATHALRNKKKVRKQESEKSSSMGPVENQGTGEHLSSFHLTPFVSKRVVLEDTLRRWNCARGGPTHCCPYHTAARDAQLAVKYMLSEPCNPFWMPLSDGQCSNCGSMQEGLQDDEVCDICGSEVSWVLRERSLTIHDSDGHSMASQDLAGSGQTFSSSDDTPPENDPASPARQVINL
eukprot:gnl/MRDRNA2_/MRDRNA2_157836_c0_seq1.p1 gnl/MRDRNA2_/MRDRNA2_157836_c0~~gnl/MRDRNA2_/MRDRNA2_157836_c0_seq1.p1  ORF type:complete len:568 (+),score=83.69 gnl/MRDRNA2_/MRDRNA2_157836_c0_seq1:33-1736(+)